MSENIRKPSVLGGTMIVAGTSIGAGMLALPTVSAGMWLDWSMLLLFLSWIGMLKSSQAILEVNMHYPVGASFNSLVKDTLGSTWNIINGISISFVLYILVYAYISGGSSMISYLFESLSGQAPNRILMSFLFALILVTCVWASTWFVDRLTVIMMGGMVLSFVVSMSGILPSISISNLLQTNDPLAGRSIFVWAALSTYLTSFCFHGSVPSLVKYFGKDPLRIDKCLVYGTGITITCYFIWITVASGSVSREGFKAVIASGGNVGVLVQAANAAISSDIIIRMLDAFAFFAIATSFLGAGLGLFDYLADLFKIDDSPKGRFKTTLITFIPPMIGGIFFPDGFIAAIAWAGLFSVIWAVIVPSLMVLKVREKFGEVVYKPFKGKFVPYALIVYGTVVGVCHILVVFNILPQFK